MDITTYALAKKYVQASLTGAGALKGQAGKSAYELAVKDGYSGTEAQWLQSLKAALVPTLLWEGSALESGTVKLTDNIYNYAMICFTFGDNKDNFCYGLILDSAATIKLIGGNNTETGIRSMACECTVTGTTTNSTDLKINTINIIDYYSESFNSKLKTAALQQIYGLTESGSAEGVTAANITSALGYTPGAVSDVQINSTSILSDGAANIPIASSANLGVIKSGNRGVSVRASDGLIYLTNPSAINISDRKAENYIGFGAINTANYDSAVKAAMCDGVGAAWTATEQSAALSRLGITVDSDGVCHFDS